MENDPHELPPPKTRATRWLVRSAVACLVLAALCWAAGFIITLREMLVTFDAIATSPTTPPQVASQVAHTINMAMVPMYAVFPLGILGIVLLILGLVIRQPVAKQGK